MDAKSGSMFVTEPESVVFSQYEPGNSYEIVLQLRNVDSVSRQLRVIPPTTQEFKIDTGGLIVKLPLVLHAECYCFLAVEVFSVKLNCWLTDG